MKKEYKDKDINSMILFLRINKHAEIQYIDNDNNKTFYDYMSRSTLTRNQLVSAALDKNWKEDWRK
tara:strand:- start:17822 stop:18019 length:198 start_codon:yes stop_codon:yes gene_type:complete